MVAKVAKNYYFSNINRDIKDINQIANKKILKNIWGIYPNIKKINNAKAI